MVKDADTTGFISKGLQNHILRNVVVCAVCFISILTAPNAYCQPPNTHRDSVTLPQAVPPVVRNATLDSTILAQLTGMSKSIQEVKGKPDWTTIIVAFITGSFLLLVQFIERRFRKKQDFNNQMMTAYYECESMLYQLRSLFAKLATDKYLTEFWWCYATIADKENVTMLVDRYTSDSKASSKSAIDCEQKIGRKFSEYYASVMKFYVLRELSIKRDDIKAKINELKFKDASLIVASEYPECKKQYQVEREELIVCYLEQLSYFNALNNSLHAEVISQLKKGLFSFYDTRKH